MKLSNQKCCPNKISVWHNAVLSHRRINIRINRLISCTNFNAHFLYSLTICILHYNPRHVSSINMPIFRRTNCVITASGIVTLCKRLYSMSDESRLQSGCLHWLRADSAESALNQCTVQTFTESEDTRCCVNTIFPPEDGHVNARNMSRIIV